MPEKNSNFIAGCHCGSASIICEGLPVLQLICHCADCREASNSDFVETAFFKRSQIEISGDLKMREFVSSAGNKTARGICPECKAMLTDVSEGFPGLVGINSEYFDHSFRFKADAQMWVSSKLDHVKIDQEIPIWMGNPEA